MRFIFVVNYYGRNNFHYQSMFHVFMIGVIRSRCTYGFLDMFHRSLNDWEGFQKFCYVRSFLQSSNVNFRQPNVRWYRFGFHLALDSGQLHMLRFRFDLVSLRAYSRFYSINRLKKICSVFKLNSGRCSI